MRTAIISGSTGQDGFYLASYLLNKKYKVIGIKRTTSVSNDARIKLLMMHPNLRIVHGDITDLSSMQNIIRAYQPDEFYHLASVSHVGKSFQIPISVCHTNGLGTLNCLEAIRLIKPDTKFYFAGSSEMFGDQLNISESLSKDFLTLDEQSQMLARSPYGASKIYGYNITRCYRESYGIFACNGILFNHTSPLRTEHFVSRKITTGIRDIIRGISNNIKLGNINTARDWGFAGSYVKAMHMILNNFEADDFVIATGRAFSIKEFLEIAFHAAGLGDYEKYIEISEDFFRPADINILLGDATKAKTILEWQHDIDFPKVIEMMVKYDLETDPTKKRKLIGDALADKGGL